MAERKVKCSHCGKWFKAAGYRHTLCASCSAAERAKKVLLPSTAQRLTPSPPVRTAPERVRPVDAPVAQPVVAVTTAVAEPTPYRSSAGAVMRPEVAVKVAAIAALRRPVELSYEQRRAVETRYLELADPREYDGIRSQIAGELKLPKALVKRAVNELRQRLGRLSWWEAERAAIPADILDRVKGRYLALLAEQPLPPVGVHRQLAGELGLTSLQVYRAIGQVRADLGLPKFNERPEEMPEAAEEQAVQAL